jgi:hypothetical protein
VNRLPRTALHPTGLGVKIHRRRKDELSRATEQGELLMVQVVVDPVLVTKLQGFTQPVELCDGSGNVLGQFTPAAASPVPRYPEPPPLSEEEIQRREQEPDYSTAEVLDRLRSL